MDGERRGHPRKNQPCPRGSRQSRGRMSYWSPIESRDTSTSITVKIRDILIILFRKSEVNYNLARRSPRSRGQNCTPKHTFERSFVTRRSALTIRAIFAAKATTAVFAWARDTRPRSHSPTRESLLQSSGMADRAPWISILRKYLCGVIQSFRKEAPMIPDRFWLTDAQFAKTAPHLPTDT